MKPLRLLLLMLILPAAACQTTSEPAMDGPADHDAAGELAPFYGYWEGTTPATGADPRVASLLVEPADGSFVLLWQNLAASPAAGVVMRESELVFEPTGTPGQWRAVGLDEGVSGISTLEGATLTTVIEGQTEEGPARQVYERSVDGETMRLTYTYEVAGEVRRVIEATYQQVLRDGTS